MSDTLCAAVAGFQTVLFVLPSIIFVTRVTTMETTTQARRFSPVPFTQVRIEDNFWSPRIRVNRERTLPAEYRQCRDTGRIDAFKLDWKPGQEHKPHQFWDSDVAKWIEAASYSLAAYPDSALEAQLDEVIALIAAAQQADGYMNSYYTTIEPAKRWTNLRDMHELYCAGHMIEAAVAHFETTGKRTFLDVMCRYANYIDSVFGPEEGKKRGYCGHEEIELALFQLYRVTGEARYLRLCQYFVDERGRQPFYFDVEAEARGEKPQLRHTEKLPYEYCQAHLPVREQREVVGHAVRAMYLYSAMADLAGELDDAALLDACRHLWNDLCLKKMYLTGGIGPSKHNEGFTTSYDLPNDTAYAETCAAIGLVFWNHRMAQVDCDSRYADVMERALYNGVISGVSLDGEKFFYVNPLASKGAHHRQSWFGCACCPPNIARLLASLGRYIYSVGSGGIAVHLYAQGAVTTTLADGTPLTLRQQTNYPWEGMVKLTVEPSSPTEFTLRLRIPGWCRNFTLTVNGQAIEQWHEHPAHDLSRAGSPCHEKGYACLTRVWQAGDVVELEMAMPIERIAAHPDITDDSGRVALQRGPIVYCLEDADHAAPVHQIVLPQDANLRVSFDADLLGGVPLITGDALAIERLDTGLYYPADMVHTRPVTLRGIPYYAWDNREPGRMVVWLPQQG